MTRQLKKVKLVDIRFEGTLMYLTVTDGENTIETPFAIFYSDDQEKINDYVENCIRLSSYALRAELVLDDLGENYAKNN